MNPLECVSMSNQERKVRTETVNVNSSEPLFNPLSIKQVIGVVVVTVFMVSIEKCVFLMLLGI